jgi:hypothetical protein
VVLGLAALAWGGPRTLRHADAAIAAALAEPDGGADAIERALDLAALHPTDPWGWSAIAVALTDSDPAAALRLAGRAMQLDPQGPEPHRVAARALLALDRPDQALLELKLAIALSTRELPDLVDVVVARWPDAEDRLSVVPDDPARARRVVQELKRTAGPELASEAWARVLAREAATEPGAETPR